MSQVEAEPTWDDLFRLAVARLPHKREAGWMIEEVGGEPLGRLSGPAPEAARQRVLTMIERRRSGEPLQYVLGVWPFRHLELMVDRRVLIPRPETEQVVDVALAELDAMVGGPGTGRTVVDLGTGSGAIALSLANERTNVDVWAVDASAAAADVARANLAGLAATRVRVVEGDWFEALPAELTGRVDLIVSNPPYISRAEMADLDPEVAEWEPTAALEAGPAGTEAIGNILDGAPRWLRADGVAVIEIAPHQAATVTEMAAAAGFGHVTVEPDLAGRPRALVARRVG